jgi:hypothetical protein
MVGGDQWKAVHGYGKCRGAPPSVLVLAPGWFVAVYPILHETETCGAYSPRVPLEDAE